MSTPPPRPSPPGARGRWLAFFVVLVLLAAGGAVLPIVINLRQQLRPAQLEEARERWRRHGPRSYDLEYTVLNDRDPHPDRYLVLVRGGRVTLAACNGAVVWLDPAVTAAAGLPARALGGPRGGYDVDAVFAHIERLLRDDEAGGRRNYLTAIFDGHDGHPRRLVHRVRRSDTREEWNLLVSPPGQAGRRGRANPQAAGGS
jgi:hypothetical protein